MPRRYHPAMVDMTASWTIGDVEIPSRIVLAPMAGVSVQAFRRQGRRFGAGLVCSEMVSSCGLSYGNERTLGYLRISSDEHPLAVQIFGSEAARMAEAAQMVVAAGADIVDINFGCPVRKVTKTGAGASALEDHDLACEVVGAVVDAVDVPVMVKMRRGLRNGSRAALELGPKLEAVGVASLTLHPRSAQQMYTGTADHSLTAELVELVGVPVIASGDITDRRSAERVLEATGAAAVMVGRGAQGRPWALREMAGEGAGEAEASEVVAELVRFMREVVREMGDERATGFLRKFYGWYLRGLPGAKQIRGTLVTCETVQAAERTLLAACPEAWTLLAAHEAELELLPDSESDRLLDLPISIYGGG
jgi:tRNA-dihydrouridine synthase B